MPPAAPRLACRQRGFTLVEVVIALVIFVVGALAIVRIFPPALAAIRGSEEKSRATHSNRGLLASMTAGQVGDSVPVPDATYDCETTNCFGGTQGGGDAWADVSAAVVGTANRSGSLPADVNADLSTSALGRFRFIRGEPAIVMQDQAGTLFCATRFPYDSALQVRIWALGTGSEGSLPSLDDAGQLSFVGAKADLNGTQIDLWDPLHPYNPRPELRWANAGSPTAVFYLSYNWSESGLTEGTSDEPLIAREPNPVPVTPDKYQVAQGARLGTGISPGQVKSCWFRFYLGQYAPTAATGVDDAMQGHVDLTAANATLQAAGLPPLTPGSIVSLDYRVAGWDWVVDQDPGYAMYPPAASAGGVPAPTPVPVDLKVNLGVRHVGGSTGPVLYTELLGVDRTNGQQWVQRGYCDSGGNTASSNTGQLSLTCTHDGLRSGRYQLRYDPTLVDGVRVRSVFHSDDSWAQQLSVAAKSYLPFIAGAPASSTLGPSYYPVEGWRQYELVGSDVYFHASEAGKQVRMQYRLTATGPVVDKVLTIAATLGNPPSSLVTGGFVTSGIKVSHLTLTDANGDPATPAGIVAVQGVSLTSRSAWIGTGRWRQSLFTSMR